MLRYAARKEKKEIIKEIIKTIKQQLSHRSHIFPKKRFLLLL